jgi:uncharacterized protein (TIGR03083 family)
MSLSTSGLSVAEHLEVIRHEGGRFAALVEAGDLDATVPTCPEWTLRDLAQHLGRTHHWAAANVEQARDRPLTEAEQEDAWGSMPADADLVGWYEAAVTRLVRAIGAASPDLQCWTFLPGASSARAFWARRQAHELTIHRVDAEGVRGEPTPVASPFALDGIDELLFGFFGRRRSRLRSQTPRTLSIRADGESWLVHIGAEGASTERSTEVGECSVEGRACDIYVALWNRLPLRDVYRDGDPGVLDLWTANATIRWS